jgi:RNA polymerase primary sigma factor
MVGPKYFGSCNARYDSSEIEALLRAGCGLDSDGQERKKTNGLSEDSLDLHLKDIRRYAPLSRAEESELARRARGGDLDALQKLVCGNLRFVIYVAKKYQNRGLSLPDLVAEGYVGLMRAAEKFDESRNIRFISYATWWIRQSILQALNEQVRLVRLPLNKSSSLLKFNKKLERASQELGRTPTSYELARLENLDPNDVEAVKACSLKTYSLDAPLSAEEGAATLSSHIQDPYAQSPEDVAFQAERSKAVDKALASLGRRESYVLKKWFGLDGEEKMTLGQIGEVLGITRERVRQIKERALDRLRSNGHRKTLEEFLV